MKDVCVCVLCKHLIINLNRTCVHGYAKAAGKKQSKILEDGGRVITSGHKQQQEEEN